MAQSDNRSLFSGLMAGVFLVATTVTAEAATPAQRNLGPVAPDSRAVSTLKGGWACVSPQSNLIKKKNAVSVQRLSTGTYIVRFSSSVRACTYQGTIGLCGASGRERPGEIQVVGAAADAKGVFVTTTDSAGVSADRGYHLLVTCP